MTLSGIYTAAVDRIVDGKHAVLLVENDEGETIDEKVVPVTELPEQAQDELGLVSVKFADDSPIEYTYLQTETQKRRESIKETLDRISTPLSERTEDE